jgi:hypothetical protein
MAEIKLTSLVQDKEVLRFMEFLTKTPAKELTISLPGVEIGKSDSSVKGLPKECTLLRVINDFDGGYVEIYALEEKRILKGAMPFEYLVYKTGTL